MHSAYLFDEVCSIFPDCCTFVLLFTDCSLRPFDTFVLLFTVLLVVLCFLSTSFAGTLLLAGIFSFLLLFFCWKKQTDPHNYYYICYATKKHHLHIQWPQTIQSMYVVGIQKSWQFTCIFSFSSFPFFSRSFSLFRSLFLCHKKDASIRLSPVETPICTYWIWVRYWPSMRSSYIVYHSVCFCMFLKQDKIEVHRLAKKLFVIYL